MTTQAQALKEYARPLLEPLAESLDCQLRAGSLDRLDIDVVLMTAFALGAKVACADIRAAREEHRP